MESIKTRQKLYNLMEREVELDSEKEILKKLLLDESLLGPEDKELVILLCEIAKQGQVSMLRRILNFKSCYS